jgi:hypothetical protein
VVAVRRFVVVEKTDKKTGVVADSVRSGELRDERFETQGGERSEAVDRVESNDGESR